MPVVELSILRMRNLLGGAASRKQILDTLPFLGLDIESVSGDGVRVEYSPNRPDYSVDYGIALGLEGLLGIKVGGVDLGIKKSDYRISVDSSVSGVRPYISGICALRGRIDQHMIRQLVAMQEDLHLGIGRRRKKSSIGIHDLDTISFPLRYAAVGRGHELIPLHETKSMTAEQILSDTETGRDYVHLLGGSKLVPMILDSAGNTVSFPPVINSSLTAVTTRTRNLFVEVTGMDRDDAEDALSVVSIILRKAGFDLYRVGISGSKNSTPKFSERRITINPSLVRDILGIQLSVPGIISCLKKARITAVQKDGRIQCVIPRHRFDMLGPMDVVEEVALGYGIARLEPKLSPSMTMGHVSDTVKKMRVVNSMMIGLGYTEALSSSLTSARVLHGAGDRAPKGTLSVLDSKSREHTILRDSILPGLVDALSRNIHQPYPQRLYETGTVFLSGRPVRERTNLAAVAAYKSADYSELKSVIRSALKLGFDMDVKTVASSNRLFGDGRCANVLVGGKKVGIVGEISSSVLERLKIRVPVAGFEVALTGLIFD